MKRKLVLLKKAISENLSLTSKINLFTNIEFVEYKIKVFNKGYLKSISKRYDKIKITDLNNLKIYVKKNNDKIQLKKGMVLSGELEFLIKIEDAKFCTEKFFVPFNNHSFSFNGIKGVLQEANELSNDDDALEMLSKVTNDKIVE